MGGLVEDAKLKTRSLRKQPEIVIRPGFVAVSMKYRGKNEQNEIPQL